MPSIPVDVSGTTTLVVAPGANKKLRVEAGYLSSNGTPVVRLEDTDGTDLTGPLYGLAVAGGDLTLQPNNGQYQLDLAANKGLVLKYDSGSGSIGGFLTYSVIGF